MARDYARSARRWRILSNIFYVLAGLFFVAGVVVLITTGRPTAFITICSGLLIAVNAFSIRMSALTYDRLAGGQR